MGMSRAGACDVCGLRWRERVAGELCPVCTTRQRVADQQHQLDSIRRFLLHDFKPGDPRLGWERQCAEISLDGLRHCGYAPEVHPFDTAPFRLGEALAELSRAREMLGQREANAGLQKQRILELDRRLLGLADAERQISRLRAALDAAIARAERAERVAREALELQREYFGNGMGLHLAMSSWAEKANRALVEACEGGKLNG